jgi:hypothetical protein
MYTEPTKTARRGEFAEAVMNLAAVPLERATGKPEPESYAISRAHIAD